MQFILTGFTHDAGVRNYAFTGIADATRTDFTVGVELALISGYGIRIQELPLLCRGILERQGEGVEQRLFTLSGEDMRIYSENCATAKAAALKKKGARQQPPTSNAGTSWRVQTP